MAEGKGITRYVRAIFDRAAGKKMEQDFADSLQRAGEEGGRKAGRATLTELRHEFDKKKADLARGLASGVISQKEFKKQTDLAAQTFRQGILKLMDEAKAKGAAGEREYIRLARQLKRVGDAGQKDIGRVNTSMDRLRGIALKVTAILGSLWVVRRVAEFGKAIFDLGSAALAVGNQFNTVFGDELGRMLRERTEELRLMAGLTRKESEEILAGAGSMAQGFGMSAEASAAFSQQIVQLSADLASFNNVPTADAAKLIQSALIGNTEAARSLKVSFTALDVQNRALAMTGKGTAKELTQEEKALAALAVMTERAGPMIGDLNRTQHDSDNVAKQLAGSYRQVKESLAAVLVEGTAGQLGLTMLRDLFRDLDNWVRANSESIQLWASTVVQSLGAVGKGFRAVWNAVKAVADLFSGVLFGVLAAGARGFSLLGEAVALAVVAKAKFQGLFSKELEQRALAEAAAIRENAKAIREWAKAAEETAGASIRGAFFPGRGSGATGVGREWGAGTGTGGGTGTGTGGGGAGSGTASAQPEISVQTGLKIPPPTFATPEAIAENQAAAREFVGPWEEALVGIEAAFYESGGVIAGMAEALAEGGIVGLAKYAAAKVKQNLASALEMAAFAVGRLMFGDVGGAADAAKSAAMHMGAAARWKLAAAAMGGGGGGGASAAGLGGGGNIGTRADRAQPAGPEVNIHLIGEGFDAINPRVQQVVNGAQQAALERYGTNATIRVRR